MLRNNITVYYLIVTENSKYALRVADPRQPIGRPELATLRVYYYVPLTATAL
jgi:hypothetical protein